MKTKKRKGMGNLAPRCPYCGSHTILRSAEGIYIDNSRDTKLYVCKNYPRCDSYVRVHPGTLIPVGTVANRELRALRAEAHRHFDRLHKEGFMSKQDAYQWLASTLGVPESQAHIGYLSEYYCNTVIQEANKLLSWYRQKRSEHASEGGAEAS